MFKNFPICCEFFFPLFRKNDRLNLEIKRVEEKLRVEKSRPLEPTNEYETHRKRLIKNIQIMWEYLKERTENLKKLGGHNLKYLLDNVYQHKL